MRVLPSLTVEHPAALPFSLIDFPRTYRVSGGYRLFFLSLGAIAVFAGAMGAWCFGTGHEMQSLAGMLLLTGGSVAFALLGIYMIALALRYSVILSADAIVLNCALRSRSFMRTDIGGRRVLPTQYVSTLVLLSRSGGGEKMKVWMMLKTDPAFHAWLEGIPDLDAEERRESEKSLAVDPDLGFESADRAQRVQRARQIAKPLNIVGFGSLVWAFFYPQPYIPLMFFLAVLPLVALALLLRSNGIYQIDQNRNDTRPTLGGLFIAPGLGLALRAMLDLNLLGWKTPLALSLFLATVMVIAIVRGDPGTRKRPVSIAIISVLCLAYGFGLTAQGNALLDRSAAQVFQAVVVDKHVSEGKSTTYYLHLNPWGPQTGVTEVSVDESFYNATPSGAMVCVYLHAGALRIPWYQVDRCP